TYPSQLVARHHLTPTHSDATNPVYHSFHHNRDLLSFPPRRSSDLGGTAAGTFTGAGALEFGPGTHLLTSSSSIILPTVEFSGARPAENVVDNVCGATRVSRGTAEFTTIAMVYDVGRALVIS